MSVMPRSSDLVFQNKSHYEPVFNNRYYEKLFIINDYCDGIVWEKLHGDDRVIATTYWYPGWYSDWAYTHTLVSGLSDDVGVVCPQRIPGERIYRTAHFVVASDSLWYYKPRNNLRYSKDGLNWYPTLSDVPGSWGHPAQGWSCDSDTGIIRGTNKDGVDAVWSITLEDGKPPKIEKIADIIAGETYSGYYGNYLGRGTAKKQQIEEGDDPKIEYYRFMNISGSTFLSQLPVNYQYTDLEPQDPAQKIKYASYNWRIEYYCGKFYATAKQNIIRYYNTVKEQWQMKKNMIMVESSDCFNSILVHVLEEDCPDTDYQDWVIGDGGIAFVKNNGRWTGLVDYIVIPLVGDTGSDGRDCVILNINSEQYKGIYETTITEDRYPYIQHRAYVRQIDFESMKSAIHISGETNDNAGFSYMPTGFLPNGWSDNAFNTGGFIYVGDLQHNDPLYHQADRAWFTNTYMVDKGNATWGEDDWYIYYNVKDYINAYDRIGIDETYGYKRYGYKITGNPVGSDHIKLHNKSRIKCEMQNWDPDEDYGRGAFVTEKFRTRTLRRGQLTWFDFSACDNYDETSEYYVCAEEDPLIDSVTEYKLSPDSGTHRGFNSKAYCFMVHWKNESWYMWYHTTGPLVISAEEFDAFYENKNGSRTELSDVSIYRFFGQQWYVAGLKDGLSGNRSDCDRYVDMGYLDNTNNKAKGEIVYQCLRRVFEA